jgi:hypothetical protein
VDVIDGPLLGPFGSRAEALRCEVEWLEHDRF